MSEVADKRRESACMRASKQGVWQASVRLLLVTTTCSLPACQRPSPHETAIQASLQVAACVRMQANATGAHRRNAAPHMQAGPLVYMSEVRESAMLLQGRRKRREKTACHNMCYFLFAFCLFFWVICYSIRYECVICICVPNRGQCRVNRRARGRAAAAAPEARQPDQNAQGRA